MPCLGPWGGQAPSWGLLRRNRLATAIQSSAVLPSRLTSSKSRLSSAESSLGAAICTTYGGTNVARNVIGYDRPLAVRPVCSATAVICDDPIDRPLSPKLRKLPLLSTPPPVCGMPDGLSHTSA